MDKLEKIIKELTRNNDPGTCYWCNYTCRRHRENCPYLRAHKLGLVVNFIGEV